jgi:carbamoyl-phosphate synthase large subunit
MKSPVVLHRHRLSRQSTGVDGLDEILDPNLDADAVTSKLRQELRIPGPDRLWYVADAFRQGWSMDEAFEFSKIDPWFLVQIEDLVTLENEVRDQGLELLDKDRLFLLKRKGFSDRRLAKLLGIKEDDVRQRRYELDVHPVYKRVDSCAAEFTTATAYMYSTYEEECEAEPTTKDKIMVLGGGPNRIGQGIEFDYCCVHAALAMREDGYETIMVNCNPETVSTDYDTSDRLYFEPLTLEDVLEIVRRENPKGVIVQYGGQTPLKLARALEAAGTPIIGTTPDSIDLAEDRERFQKMIQKLGLLQPRNCTARNAEEAVESAREIGFPLVVRPSYVLGGRAMEIVYSEEGLLSYMQNAVQVSNDSPILLDRFLDNAVELDVDAICDGKDVLIGGVMEHIEQAGVHSGDSACSLPPYSVSAKHQAELREQTIKMAHELSVVGLMNVQFAIQDDQIYVIEVNPRASRTVPFVSKAIGRPLAKVAARCMAGQSLAEQGMTKEIVPPYYSVKEAVFPFAKFPGVDPLLGPEMKSTGEVMGVGATFAEAFAKSQIGASMDLPTGGSAFVSVRDADKQHAVQIARDLAELGYKICSTRGTARLLEEAGIECQQVNKVDEGRPHIVDMIKNENIHFIVNTTEGRQAIADSFTIRRQALQHKVTYTTTVAGARAMLMALRGAANYDVSRIQDLHKELPA